jgi:hypothetical protein
MKRKIFFAAFLLWTWCVFGADVRGQENKPPFTKAEILRLLKPVPGVRFEQGDLAGEIAQRGIAFPVDEKTLVELRKAGARSFLIEAIQRAAQNPTRPQLQPQPANETPVNTARPQLQQRPATEAQTPKEEDRAAARAAALARLPLLEQARYHAAEFVEELPNFIVTQFVTRSVRAPERKDWQVEDKLEVELTYRAKKGEQFKLLRLNGKPTQLSYEQLGGATSSGEFGSILAALFAPQSKAEFKEVKRETFHGRQTVLYDFRVKKAFSRNQITDKSSGRTVTAGYQGSVWIEVETGRVLRVEQSADDIQSGFPITLAESAVEYDWVTIAGKRYLMPVYAEVIIGRDSERFYSRNVIELRNYQIFDTDLKILPEKEPQQ